MIAGATLFAAGTSSRQARWEYQLTDIELLRVSQYMDKLLVVNIQGGRKVSGYLRGFDIFLNVVIDEAREEQTADKTNCGTVVSLESTMQGQKDPLALTFGSSSTKC